MAGGPRFSPGASTQTASFGIMALDLANASQYLRFGIEVSVASVA